MRSLLLLIALTCLACPILAQYVYTIKADSVKITNCDSAELILENHTQNIPGFLFNTGNGRTVFQRGAQQLGNGLYLVGADTIKTSTNAWLQGGNAWGATGVLGTLDSNNLDLYTDGNPRIRITANGYVGIGTTSPLAPLHVVGNELVTLAPQEYLTVKYQGNPGFNAGINYNITNADGVSNSFGLKEDAYTDGVSNNIVEVNQYNASYTVFDGGEYLFAQAIQLNGGFEGGQNVDLPIILGNNSSTPTGIKFYMAGVGTPLMTLMQNGNVGIGTASPSTQFHTTGSVRFAGLTQDSTQTQVLVSDANGNLYYRSASSLAATDVIRSSFAVNGPISAQQLTLSRADWADYVFDSAYNLPSLTETEDYIHRQHHLPGIPSVAEVKNKGVDVGETQVALLKKIEELTLYAIGQDKKLDEQATEIQALKAEMEVLTKLIRNNPEK